MTDRILAVSSIYPDANEPHQGTFIHQRVRQLAEQGFDVRVFKREHISLGSYLGAFKRVYRFYRSPKASSYSWDGLTIHRRKVHMVLPLNYAWSAPARTYRAIRPDIERIRKSFPFDLAYLATWGDLPLAMSRIAREMGIPYVACAIGGHDNDYYDKPASLYYHFHRETYENARLVICVSRDLSRKIQILTEGRANTFTFYSGVDTRAFARDVSLRMEYRARLGYSDAETVILHVSRLEKTKGIYDLLRAFARVASRHPSARLLLVGPHAERRRFRREIRKCGLEDKVKLPGPAPHAEIPGYMNAADVFVLASWMEGLPNVVMEASACELPVVASAVGGIPELVEEQKTGVLAPPRSPSDLAAKIEALLRAPEQATRMGRAGREKMLRDFNYDRNGAAVAEKIRQVLGHAPPWAAS